jgi:hypothetical protein
MKKSKTSKRDPHYQAPLTFVGLFYAALVAWTVLCVWLIGSKTLSTGWPLGQLLMIGFVLAYTWYFSLGISYEISIETGGSIKMTSFRRVLSLQAQDISLVEGPRLAVLPYSFIRFRLKREKAYLFACITDEEVRRILKIMQKNNPEMKLKGIY